MNKLSRRTFLKSSTAAIMLPILESNGLAVVAGSNAGIPKRLVFLAMGYGVNPETWFPDPSQTGAQYELPSSLKPFEDLKPDISVLQNLTNRYYVTGHTGSTTFLTSVNPRSVPGVAFANAVSCDQIAAEVLGRDTRHSSLAIGYEGRTGDGHGRGAYNYVSWGRNGKPVGVYRKLTDLYAALFGAKGVSPDEVRVRLNRNQSSLDALIGNAKRLNNQVSASDRDRVDEYFTSIRSVEERLNKAKQWVDRPYPDAPFELPSQEEEGFSGGDLMELTFDMMHSALQSDSTRVISYMMPSTGILKDFDSPINSHNMSHHGGKPDWTVVQQQRDLIFSQHVARFLQKLKETKQVDGSSLLDHSLIAYGSSLRKGHGQANGPMILAGHGGGGIKQGQNLVYDERSTPLSNLWLSMIRHVGAEQTHFADSDGVLSKVGFS